MLSSPPRGGSTGGHGALPVVLATEQLGVDESDFGLLVAALSVWASIGPLLFGRLDDRLDSPVLLFIPYLVRGVIDAALAFLTGFWIPAEHRGQVFSAFNTI